MEEKDFAKAKNNLNGAINIINFVKDDSFFFKITKLKKILKGITKFDRMKPIEDKIIIVKNEIKNLEN